MAVPKLFGLPISRAIRMGFQKGLILPGSSLSVRFTRAPPVVRMVNSILSLESVTDGRSSKVPFCRNCAGAARTAQKKARVRDAVRTPTDYHGGG